MRFVSGKKGFTLVEAVVGLGILGILMVGVLGVYSMLARAVKVNREKTEISTLAAGYMEVVRNMPYSQIGTINGNPSGSLPDFTNPQSVNTDFGSYNIYYEITYVDDPADGTILLGTDPSPNDYKQAKVFIRNSLTGVLTNFVTNVSPQGLENINNAGALLIKVFDATGQPVEDANIHIQNALSNPPIVLDRLSDAAGNWMEVGLPAGVNAYHIVVSKPGYSTDQTYPITAQNPNPIKPDATIVNGQVTQVSFVIDLLSNLTIRTLSQTCQNLNGVGVNVRGDKLIGLNPNVYKFNQNFSSAAGQIVLNNIEWDTYTPTLLAGQGLMIYGTSPIRSINVLPGASQTFTLILGPYTTNSLLVIVKDASNMTLLEGAQVHLRKGGSVPQDYYGTTGGSVWVQNDWTGGSGQVNFSDATRYFADNGNLDVNSSPTGVRLRKLSGRYLAPGELESSTFDTGTSATNFTTLTWEPTSQAAGTELKFQIATNNDNATWQYKGPDGTAASYYYVSGTNIGAAHNNFRYVRYKIFENTADNRRTPILTGLAINYITGCFTPGQTIFTNLTAGNNYDLDVSLAGYQTAVINSLDIQGNQSLEVLLSR